MLVKPKLWSRADLNPHVKAIFNLENLKNIDSALTNQVNIPLTNLHMVFPLVRFIPVPFDSGYHPRSR